MAKRSTSTPGCNPAGWSEDDPEVGSVFAGAVAISGTGGVNMAVGLKHYTVEEEVFKATQNGCLYKYTFAG